jgi:hypothetical protein
MIRKTLFAIALVAGVGTSAGCSAASVDDDEAADGTEMQQSQDEVREVIPGPLARSTDAEVWAIENQWADKSTANARKAGMAWGADSGLTWEEKYQKWVESFERVDAVRYGKTIRFATPYGHTMDGPVLECADVTIWLRMTFAAWYHLPFYMTGWRSGQTIYFGHFGVVDRNGAPVSGFPRFKSSYRDFERTWRSGDRWPSDPNLRRRRVGPDDGAAGVRVGDEKYLAEGDGAGAYFDELFLNKRAGYLMALLDVNFGSQNLADGANLFHIQPEATAPGDALVHRWQKNGIGHVLPVMSSVTLNTGKLRVTTASGSMPRRQPVWEDEAQSGNYFKNSYAGGRGEASDGTPYAKLGGGIRRWRTAVVQGGRWHNIVPQVFRPVYIEDQNVEAIASRPERFRELLAEDTPEAARDAALATIGSTRASLRERPASCSSRSKREEAFDALYEVMSRSFGMSRSQVDAQYRTLEDYVFAELEYDKSKTCCWNSTTPEMANIVLDYAEKEKARSDEQGVCRQPTPFRSSGGGKYDTWKAHASAIGRAGQWREWSEDEPCQQRGVIEDTVGERGLTNMCR